MPSSVLQPTSPSPLVIGGKWMQEPIQYLNNYSKVSWAGTVMGIGTIAVVPFVQPVIGSYTAVDVFVSANYSATNAGSSRADSLSMSIGVYTKFNSSLSLLQSTSVSTAFTVTGSSSSGSYHGLKNWVVPMNLPLDEGNYWFALASSSASAGNAIAAVGGFSNIVASFAGGNSAYLGQFGQASAVSEQANLGQGTYSVTSASLPNVIGFSELIGSAIGNTLHPIFVFKGFTA